MGNPCTRFASGPGALTQTEADLGEEVYEAVPPILVVIVPRGQKAQLGGGFTGLRNAKPSPVGNAEGRVWGTIANTARDRNAVGAHVVEGHRVRVVCACRPIKHSAPRELGVALVVLLGEGQGRLVNGDRRFRGFDDGLLGSKDSPNIN